MHWQDGDTVPDIQFPVSVSHADAVIARLR
jgi:hypothetical protein